MLEPGFRSIHNSRCTESSDRHRCRANLSAPATNFRTSTTTSASAGASIRFFFKKALHCVCLRASRENSSLKPTGTSSGNVVRRRANVAAIASPRIGTLSAQSRRRNVIQQSGIDRVVRARRNGIAITHIKLHRTTRIPEPSLQPHTQATIAVVFANLFHRYRRRIVLHAVNGHDAAYFTHRNRQCFSIRRSKSEKVYVARRPMRYVKPQVEQQRAFQQRSIPCWRQRQAIKKTLVRIARENQIEVFATLLSPIQKTGMDRRSQMGAHASASR